MARHPGRVLTTRDFLDDASQVLPRVEDIEPDIREAREELDASGEEDLLLRHRSDSDLVHHYPIYRFIAHTARDTWHYAGKGVKLGNKDAIVCWYKLKGAKNPNTYRVVYGDLSVKDVAAEDLPLPVGP